MKLLKVDTLLVWISWMVDQWLCQVLSKEKRNLLLAWISREDVGWWSQEVFSASQVIHKVAISRRSYWKTSEMLSRKLEANFIVMDILNTVPGNNRPVLPAR
jgi:hypothetical protein